MASNAFAPVKGVPSSLVAGDLWAWRADGMLAAYPSDSFSLSYTLAPHEGGATATAPAVWDADGWGVSILPAETSTLTPGAYRWTLFAFRNSDGSRQTICGGSVLVKPDPAGGADTRSRAKKHLDAINAVLDKRITKDVENYSIEGRALTRTPLEILHKLRARYMAEVQAEEAVAKGRRPGLRYRKMGFGNG